ncbi:MAG: SPOR domain-containing protein [Candidatus Omnitrophica bacterium]|nr:SPOR domain-containing protein [Candidatus Omnitrophota bacterium]
MGRYSEALRKIEAERNKRDKSFSSDSISRKSIGFPFWVAVFSVILLAVVYGFGLRTGARVSEMSSHLQSSPRAELTFARTLNPKPVLPEMAPTPPNVTPEVKQSLPEVEQWVSDFYTIQLVAYRSEESAREEARKLRDEGYRSLILKGTTYYSVCIGKFPDEVAADGTLSELRSSFPEGAYQDAFVRIVRRK